MRTLTQGSYSVRYKRSWLYLFSFAPFPFLAVVTGGSCEAISNIWLVNEVVAGSPPRL